MMPFNRLLFFFLSFPVYFHLNNPGSQTVSLKEDPGPRLLPTPSLVFQTLIFIHAVAAPLLLGAFPSPLCYRLGELPGWRVVQVREDLTLPRRSLLLWHFSVRHQAAHAICSPARNTLQGLGVFLELQLLTGIKTKYFTRLILPSIWKPCFLQVGIFQPRIWRDFVWLVLVCLWWLTRVSSMPLLWGYLAPSFTVWVQDYGFPENY